MREGAPLHYTRCMKAIVLVGGEGTRLRPLTYSRPKALVPVLGRPFLLHFIEYLRGHGFDDVILAVAHGADAIRAALGDGRDAGVRLTYVDEPVPLGSAGAIANCAPNLGEETFLVANGDIVTDIDLSAMLRQHRERPALVTVALISVEDPSGFGVAEIDEDERIRRFVEKPPPEEAPSSWANAGLWMFEPQAVSFIPPGRSMVETDLFPSLADAGLLGGYRSGGYWIDLGTPRRYLQLHADLLARSALCSDAEALIEPGASIKQPVSIARGAVVRQGARIEGAAVVGIGSEVASGALVTASVLWERVIVERGAVVRNSIVAEETVIGAGAVVEDATIGPGAAIEAGARTPHGLRLDPGERFPQAEAAQELT
ncbi:MAG TPA: NDP-sugar synthase [Dehalococcoidia bacterium]|nr:NDP-sugar synthase [Dehalococcoidia bacterium]